MPMIFVAHLCWMYIFNNVLTDVPSNTHREEKVESTATMVMQTIFILTVLMMVAGCDEGSADNNCSDISDILGYYAVVNTGQFTCYDE